MLSATPSFAFAVIATSLDFESGNFNGWNTDRLSASHSGQVVTGLYRRGQYSARFELREKDYTHNGFRTEIMDNFIAQKQSSVVYAFSTFVPTNAAFNKDNRCVTTQWHDQNMDLGKPTVIHSPPLSISLSGNNLFVKLCISDSTGYCNTAHKFCITFEPF